MLRFLTQDFLVAARNLGRRSGFTAAAVATLGLAVGALAAMASIVFAIVVRPLPFPDPDRIVTVCERHPSVAGFCVASPPNVMDFAAQAPAFAALGLARDWSFTRRVDGRNAGVRAALATPGWFAALGVAPAAGRFFTPGDLGPSAARVAVVSATFAARAPELAGRPDPLGATIVLDDSSYAVVGVMPQARSVSLLEDTEVWVPLPFDPRDEEQRSWRGFQAVGRLAPAATLATAAAELRTVGARLAELHPATNRDWATEVRPLQDQVVGSARPALLAFFGATALAVLIAVMNLSVLLLVRWWDRAREIAVREALGGSRSRIAALLLTEAALVALGGVAAGTLLAPWLTRGFVRFAPSSIPRLAEVNVDAGILGMTAAGAVLLTLLLALVPTLRSTRRDLTAALRTGAQPGGLGGRLSVQRGLVVTELALASTLLIGAALLGRSFMSYLRWQPGFDHSRVAVIWSVLPDSRFPDAAATTAAFDRLREEARAVPGVAAVSQASSGPLFGGSEPGSFAPEGTTDVEVTAQWHDVGPDYFGTLGLPLVRGRDLAASDRRGGPLVVVVNEAFARRAWPGANPVGQRVRQVGRGERVFEVVGVARDLAPWRAGSSVEPAIYWPFAQSPRWGSYLVVRTAGDPASVARELEARLAAAVPDAQIGSLRTIDQAAERLLVSPRFTLLLVAGYGALTLLVAAVGLYGVIDYLVSRRRREIAIRMALGADGGSITGAVLRESVGLGVAGTALGFVGALAVRRFVAPLLAGVGSTDPLSYLLVAAGLTLVAVLAARRPARRAARTDPAGILRAE
ncbi:MAG: ADOP family duplicated permease [Gemmatimonadales bacterium]